MKTQHLTIFRIRLSSSADRADLRLSALFALVTVVLSQFVCLSAGDETFSVAWFLLLPTNLFEPILLLFAMIFGIVGRLGILLVILIISFAVKFIRVYSIARRARLTNVPLLPHLPSLLLLLAFIAVCILYIWPSCGQTCRKRDVIFMRSERCAPVWVCTFARECVRIAYITLPICKRKLHIPV